METLKVSSKSVARNVAGAIALSLQKSASVKLCAIGAGAVNQCCKAIAIATGYVAPKGIQFTVKINFSTVDIEDKEKTALEFTLTKTT
jgi:stage V sporulation protein S